MTPLYPSTLQPTENQLSATHTPIYDRLLLPVQYWDSEDTHGNKTDRINLCPTFGFIKQAHHSLIRLPLLFKQPACGYQPVRTLDAAFHHLPYQLYDHPVRTHHHLPQQMRATLLA